MSTPSSGSITSRRASRSCSVSLPGHRNWVTDSGSRFTCAYRRHGSRRGDVHQTQVRAHEGLDANHAGWGLHLFQRPLDEAQVHGADDVGVLARDVVEGALMHLDHRRGPGGIPRVAREGRGPGGLADSRCETHLVQQRDDTVKRASGVERLGARATLLLEALTPPPAGLGGHRAGCRLAVADATGQDLGEDLVGVLPVSYTHLRAHETDSYLVCRLL